MSTNNILIPSKTTPVEFGSSFCGSISTGSESAYQEFDSTNKLLSDTQLSGQDRKFYGSPSEISEIQDQQEEQEVLILNVVPLKDLQEQEKQLCLHTQIFMRKHASNIKKQLLLNSINYKLRKEGNSLALVQRANTAEDQAYQTELLVLINQGRQQEQLNPRVNENLNLTPNLSDISTNLTDFPEQQLLCIAEHPMIVEYFANNLQLLYWLERLRPFLLKEWNHQQQVVKACYQEQESASETFSSKLYPHLCWHKSKRLLSVNMLEAQAEEMKNISRSQGQMNIFDSRYITESIELLKEQKGISKLKISKAISQVKDSKKMKNKVKQALETLQLQQLARESKYSECCHFQEQNKVEKMVFNNHIQKDSKVNAASIKLKGINKQEKCSEIQGKIQINLNKPAHSQILQNNSQSTTHDQTENIPKMRDEKKETILTCSYCQGAYHLGCIISDPKWNYNKIMSSQSSQNTDLIADQVNQGAVYKQTQIQKGYQMSSSSIQEEAKQSGRGKKRKNTISIDELESVVSNEASMSTSSITLNNSGQSNYNNQGNQDQTFDPSIQTSSTQKFASTSALNRKSSSLIEKPNQQGQLSDSSFFDNSPLKQLENLSKDEINQFLARIGYSHDRATKWACKNCLFSFIVDHLSSGGDLRFQNEVAQSNFEMISVCQEQSLESSNTLKYQKTKFDSEAQPPSNNSLYEKYNKDNQNTHLNSSGLQSPQIPLNSKNTHKAQTAKQKSQMYALSKNNGLKVQLLKQQKSCQ
eukprot:403347021